jgi:hypothetical protein
MTAQEIVNTVKDNLGNRADGRIGNRSVDTVVLEGFNISFPHLAQEAQPDYYNRTASISVTIGTQEYDLPTIDIDGNEIRIKDIITHQAFRVDNSPVTFLHVTQTELIERTRGLNLGQAGIPCYFALWGKNNKLKFDYTPTEAYTFQLYVECYPLPVASTDLTVQLDINDEWRLPLECLATAYCYLKLQQVEMYTIWNDLYLKQKASISRTVNRKHGHNISAGSIYASVAEPHLNPFVKNWNN